MIALFDEPPRVSIRLAHVGRNGLLLGMLSSEHGLEGIVCLEEGDVTLLPVSEFTVDYRYQVENDRWVDVNAQEGAQEG